MRPNKGVPPLVKRWLQDCKLVRNKPHKNKNENVKMVELTLPNTKLCICQADLIKMKSTFCDQKFQNTVLLKKSRLSYTN